MTSGWKAKWCNGWYWEAICLLTYLLLAGSQLFVRPIIGLADNGDFPKALAPYSLCDPDNQRDLFAYAYPGFIVSPACRWEPDLPSTELLVVRLAKMFARWEGQRSFSVTRIGSIHLAILAAAWIILLWGLHESAPWLRFGLPPAIILVFSDVGYVAYLNSVYMDAASLVFLLLTAACAGTWVLRPRPWVAEALGVAGVLMALSKTQHAITSYFLAGAIAGFAVEVFRRRTGHKRTGWLLAAAAAATAIAATITVALTPKDYKVEPLYSVIFSRMNPLLADRSRALAELGLPEADRKYFGTHAYSESSPVLNTEWRAQFNGEIQYRRLLTYYLRHPRLTLHMLEGATHEELPGIRPGNLGNYLRKDGFPPGTLAQEFGWWTHLRAWLIWKFPIHIFLFYPAMWLIAVVCCFRPTWAARWPMYPMVMALSAAGVLEFLFAVLLDGTETARHLFLFHVITELLILCAAAGILSILAARRAGRPIPIKYGL